MKKNKWTLTALVIGCVLYCCGCGTVQDVMIGETPTFVPVVQEPVITPEPTPEPTATPVPTPTPFPEYDINIMMVGDNLMHMGIVSTGAQADGSYNYDFLFDGITEYLAQAEIKIINQETIFGGNYEGFSGYPNFNSPTEVGDAIAKAGFNVVLHASNHTADMGVSGMKNCVAFWEQYPEVMTVGIRDKEKTAQEETGPEAVEVYTEDAQDVAYSWEKVKTESGSEIPLMKIADVTFAILNYTYGPNMGSLPKSYEGYMDMLCEYNASNRLIDFTTLREEVLTDIREAEQLADVVIVCPHWGTEYTTKPSSYQKKFALQMTEAGADIIIGTHPHVIQPVEWVEAENGNRALCYYSLGNYVSTQKQTLCMLEGMAWITFRMTEDGLIMVEEETGVLPLVCHYNAMPVRLKSVYLLEEYTEEQAAAHGIREYGGVTLVLSDLQKWSSEVFADWILNGELTKEKTDGEAVEELSGVDGAGE